VLVLTSRGLEDPVYGQRGVCFETRRLQQLVVLGGVRSECMPALFPSDAASLESGDFLDTVRQDGSSSSWGLNMVSPRWPSGSRK
jgi:hypothetical protein